MERRRLDERVETVLLRTAQAIEGADSTRLLQLNKLVFREQPSPERSAIQVESWLDSLLRSQVESVGGEPLPYAYQLLSENSGNAVLGSGDFDDRQLYANYARRLRGPRIIGYCRCELSLLLQVPDPMKVLLGRLRLQLTAAAAALISLLAGAGLLFFYLNRLRRLHAAKDDFLNHLVHELERRSSPAARRCACWKPIYKNSATPLNSSSVSPPSGPTTSVCANAPSESSICRTGPPPPAIARTALLGG